MVLGADLPKKKKTVVRLGNRPFLNKQYIVNFLGKKITFILKDTILHVIQEYHLMEDNIAEVMKIFMDTSVNSSLKLKLDPFKYQDCNTDCNEPNFTKTYFSNANVFTNDSSLFILFSLFISYLYFE